MIQRTCRLLIYLGFPIRASHFSDIVIRMTSQFQPILQMADQSDDDTKIPDRPSRASTFPASVLESGGLRSTFKTPRGIYKKKGEEPTPESMHWLPHIERILQYRFRNPDLLEEALESSGSGFVCVGGSNRVCVDGNKGLCRVGESVMRVVGEDGCYLFKTHASKLSTPILIFTSDINYCTEDIDSTIKNVLSTPNLVKLGRSTEIEK